MPKFDAELAIQVDVEHSANGLLEVVVVSKRLGR